MTTMIHFKGFEGFQHHYDFIEEQLARTIGRHEHARPMKVEAFVFTGNARKEFRSPEFHCEVVISQPGVGHPVVAHKAQGDFQSCVRQACRSAEKNLRKYEERRFKMRRKARMAV